MRLRVPARAVKLKQGRLAWQHGWLKQALGACLPACCYRYRAAYRSEQVATAVAR